MIIGKIKDLEHYLILPELKHIIDYISKVDLKRLSYGIYNVIDNVTLSIDLFETNKCENFIAYDGIVFLQIILDGVAKYVYADFDDILIKSTGQYNEEENIGYFEGTERGSFLLDETMFMLVFPDDLIKYDINEEMKMIKKATFAIKLA